jgi:hypothetical protein
MTIKLKINGLSESVVSLKGLLPHLTNSTILKLSQVAYDEAQIGAARHNKTGALVQSLFNRAVPGGREVGHDTRRAPQALWVNLGTRPHVIMPKNKKALRWASGGRFFFAGKVNHPGYRGDAYIIRAATLAVQQFSRILDDQLKMAP